MNLVLNTISEGGCQVEERGLLALTSSGDARFRREVPAYQKSCSLGSCGSENAVEDFLSFPSKTYPRVLKRTLLSNLVLRRNNGDSIRAIKQ